MELRLSEYIAIQRDNMLFFKHKPENKPKDICPQCGCETKTDVMEGKHWCSWCGRSVRPVKSTQVSVRKLPVEKKLNEIEKSVCKLPVENQVNEIEEIIRFGKQQGVKKMTIYASKEVALEFGSSIEGIPVKVKGGKNQIVGIKVKFY